MRVLGACLSFLFFFSCLTLLSGKAYAQNSYSISGNWENQTVKQILKDVGKSNNIEFAYSSNSIGKIRLDLVVNEVSRDVFLNLLSSRIDVRWEEVDQVIILIPEAEKKEIKRFVVSGTVEDSESGERLPGALVFFEPSQASSITSRDGTFYLSGGQPGDQKLIIRYLGYNPLIIDLDSVSLKSNISFKLAPQDQFLEEVTIEEFPKSTVFRSEEVSEISFNPVKMSSFPSMGEVDPFRSLQLLPGIGSTDENLSGISIRGASGDQSLVQYDGFRIYQLDHFFGLVSAFNSNALKSITVHKGGYEAKYGGGIAGIVDMNGKSGNSKEVRGGIGLNLLSAQARVEVPIKNWSFFFAGRRSYTDLWASPTYKAMMENVLNNNESVISGSEEKEFEDFDPTFSYYDINTKVSFRPNDKNQFALSFYNGGDFFRIDNSDQLPQVNIQTENRTNWGNSGLGLSWYTNFGKKWFSQNSIGFSNYFASVSFGEFIEGSSNSDFDETIFFNQSNAVSDINFKSDHQVVLSSKNQIEFGFHSSYNFLSYEVVQDSSREEQLIEEAYLNTLYFQDVYRPFQRLELTAGARVSYYSLRQKFFVEPRVALNYRLTTNTNLKFAWGYYIQNISRVIRRDIYASNPAFWALSDGENIPTLKSFHYILGASINLRRNINLDLEGYFKSNEGLVEYFPAEGIFAPDVPGYNPYFSGEGFSTGLDVLFQIKGAKHSAWAGYSLGFFQEKFEELNGGDFFPSANDQRHELKLAYLFKVRKWELSAVWIFGSGKPYTGPLGTISVDLPSGDTIDVLYVSEINGKRLPVYHRLDLSANYNFYLGKVKGQLGLSLFNAYNRPNIRGKNFQRNPDFGNPGGNQFTTSDVKQLGILPGISLTMEF